jgi:hypothetical protein
MAVWDKSARVRTRGDEFAKGLDGWMAGWLLDGRIGVVGQQRGALLARGWTVKG